MAKIFILLLSSCFLFLQNTNADVRNSNQYFARPPIQEGRFSPQPFGSFSSSPTIYKTYRYTSQPTYSPNEISEATKKLKRIINRHGGAAEVNSNMLSAYEVYASKEVVEDPVLRDAVQFDIDGQKCTVALCDSYGDNQVAMGACTPYFCHCGSGMAFLQSCGPGTVYDAFLKICNWPREVSYC